MVECGVQCGSSVLKCMRSGMTGTKFPRLNAAAFIFSRCFEVWRLFEGGIYSRAAFINLSTIMPIVN